MAIRTSKNFIERLQKEFDSAEKIEVLVGQDDGTFKVFIFSKTEWEEILHKYFPVNLNFQ